jgi:putative DNA primase/helicase
MPLGTQEQPVDSAEPMKMARAVMTERFGIRLDRRNRIPGLIHHSGEFFHWYGGQWMKRNPDWIERECWKWLEDAYYWIGGEGENGFKRFAPNTKKVADVVAAITALSHIDRSQTPFLLKDGKADFDVNRTIAFADSLVTVAGGQVGVQERTHEWFDPVVVPCSYNPDAECPRWMQALAEWSQGDEHWISLLQRWFGYCLESHRSFAKWMLLQGVSRSGKGTIVTILSKLVGRQAFKNTSLGELASEFGLDGIGHAQVLAVREAGHDLDNRQGERVTSVLKMILGSDPLTINAKYQRQQRDVLVRAAPMMESNQIPKLPNTAKGLSVKMLVLPFRVSFANKEDVTLIDKLEDELPGIAAWAVQGAVALEAEEDVAAKWPVPTHAENVVREFHISNNPFDAFLEARYMERAEGFADTKTLKKQWHHWLRSNKVRTHVSDNFLAMRLVEQSSWKLERCRNNRGLRGIRGMSLRKEFVDEL